MKSGNRRWKQNGNNHELYFCPFYEDGKVAELFRDEDGDWFYSSTLTNCENEYIADKETCLYDVKIDVESVIYSHYEAERNYYQELMDKFNE